MSAPTSFARCRYGVATVLSMTSGTPARWAMSDTVRTSSTCAIGFVIDSAKNARVSGRTAAAHAAGSSWSTKVTSMPQSANVSCSRSIVPPYSWRAATMCSPCLASASSASGDGGLAGGDGGGGDAALELGDAPLEHEHGRVGGAAVDVAVAAEREQVARLAQRGELEGVRLVDRRHGGVLGDTGLVPRLHLRRREGTRGLGHSSIVPGAPRRRTESCVELLPSGGRRGLARWDRWPTSSPRPSWPR